MIIKVDNCNLDVTRALCFKKRLSFRRQQDPVHFKEWNGTLDINKAFIDEIMFYIGNGTGETMEFQIEAKIKSGSLPDYPFENRTTEDGWVVVDNFELDDYHSMFLKIENNFRLIRNQISEEDQKIFAMLGIDLCL